MGTRQLIKLPNNGNCWISGVESGGGAPGSGSEGMGVARDGGTELEGGNWGLHVLIGDSCLSRGLGGGGWGV